MSSLVPFVRHMLLCDDVRRSPSDPRKVHVYGLFGDVRPTTSEAGYPLTVSFSIYLALTEGRGSGEGRIAISSADTGRLVYLGQPHRIEFGPDPLKVQGVIFRITSCSLPESGLYWVEFRYNNKTIAREPLRARDTP